MTLCSRTGLLIGSRTVIQPETDVVVPITLLNLQDADEDGSRKSFCIQESKHTHTIRNRESYLGSTFTEYWSLKLAN